MTHEPIPPIGGAVVPSDISFEMRVYWYAVWIRKWPYSHIHFMWRNGTGFISERHINF